MLVAGLFSDAPPLSTTERGTIIPWVSRAFGSGLAVAITLAITVGGATTGCGGAPPQPKRGVVESDLGSWHFRRFQPVLDVEVWVENNKAEAYTASYVSISPRGRVTSRTRTS